MDDEGRTIVTFRDGKQEVPPHVRAMLEEAGIATRRYTYEQAIRMADESRLSDVAEQAIGDLISQHFRDST